MYIISVPRGERRSPILAISPRIVAGATREEIGMRKDTTHPPIIISDLSRCRPGSALSTTPRLGHWQALPYEAEGISGTLLLAGYNCQAPTLTLPLGVRGWHAIYLGVWTTRIETSINVKLCHSGDEDSDATPYTLVTTPRPERWSSNWWATIGEVFLTCADLTDLDLLIAQQSTGQPRNAALAYVKLEPLTPGEVEAIQRDQTRTDTKRLIAYNDAQSFYYFRGATTAAEICAEIEPLRDTDVQKLIWDVGAGSNTQYFSEIGDYHYPEIAADFDFARPGDRVCAESFRILREKGIDPLDTALAYAHDLGLEFHGSYRVGGWIAAPEEASYLTGRFYAAHPEWRCVDRDGTPITRMSYAFPGVQAFVISLLREVVARGVDGVCLVFIRGLPCVLYEQPLVESFHQQYGTDPRQAPADDSRWLSHQATCITGFMRAVRHEMDRIGQEVGRHIQVSAYVLNTVSYCLSYGLDVATWAQEGLVDFIIPNPTRGRGATGDSVDVDVAGFAQVLQGSPCKLYADLLPRQMSPEAYRQKALAYYQAGADGLALWDCDTNNRLAFKHQWGMVRRLGA
ncbi:MAG: hypothetical protein EXR62_11615 [Chloroflexi bacterium]|nr:hypothetical protein [Chloroflexota bacterium]